MPATADVSIDGPVAIVTLRPDGPITSLSRGLAHSINTALDAVEAASGVHCAVIRGSGSSFIVGADVKEIQEQSAEENLVYNQVLIDVNQRLEDLDVPVIACLNGHAFGGGLELAMACSIRVASDQALVGLPEVKLGILPGAGGTVRVPRAIGEGPALHMMLTGRSVSAVEAQALGLVDEISAEPEQRTLEIAREIAQRAPLAVRAIKAAVTAVREMPVPEATKEVHRRLGGLLATHDATEGVNAFIEKRPPRFQAK